MLKIKSYKKLNFFSQILFLTFLWGRERSSSWSSWVDWHRSNIQKKRKICQVSPVGLLQVRTILKWRHWDCGLILWRHLGFVHWGSTACSRGKARAHTGLAWFKVGPVVECWVFRSWPEIRTKVRFFGKVLELKVLENQTFKSGTSLDIWIAN